MSILSKPEVNTFKPFRYPWAFEFFRTQNQVHWIPDEIPMAEDVRDWAALSDKERFLLTHIFRFFTQADTIVGDAYVNHYLNKFHYNELQMMLRSYTQMESIHQWAYSHVMETLGFSEDEYTIFMQYKEMKDKYDFAMSVNSDDTYGLMKSIAIFAAFTEGLQLFASFAILLNFPRHNKMKGMGQIVSWSARDENLHCSGMLMVLAELYKEFPSYKDMLIEEIPSICDTIVTHEDAFIDLAFSHGDLKGLTAEEVKEYVRYIADRRLEQLEAKPIYNVLKNPLPWLDDMQNGIEHANFFEVRATAYSKGSMSGDWDDDAFTV